MRTAFMTFACPEWDLATVLGTAAELGYDGVEPRIDAGHKHGLEIGLDRQARADVHRQMADAGLALPCLATSLRFIAISDDDQTALMEQAEQRIELAADLGASALRVFGGSVPEGVSMQQAMEVAAEHLRTVGEVAQGAGIELWLETHDTFSKGKHAGQVVALASHPAVQINYDVMHPLRNGESLDQTFEALNGYIRHAHWHDCLLDPKKVAITRFGEGEMPLVDILRRLDTVGFEGYLSGEWFGDQLGSPPREALTHYIEATKALLQEI